MTDQTRITGVHLDLKYTMPRKDYLMEWVRRLPEFGIDTLLIEYEDKFPFQRHPFLRDQTAFTAEELSAFLAAVREAGVRPVPLVQSMSHLEFALAHDELAHLREAPDIHTQICPSNPEAVEFVQGLVREVLAFHREDELFHLGGDETWFLGTCPRCTEWVARVGGTVPAWVEHQRSIMSVVQETGKRPIYWDDVFWKRPERVREVDLPKDVVLHSWDYAVRPDKGGSGVLERVDVYQGAGYDVLAGPCLDWGSLYPRHVHCLQNTEAWARKAHASRMLGMINTGWAVFHVPLPAKWLHIAATGALMNGTCETPDHAWQRGFLAREYGAELDGVPEALEALGCAWEVPCGGLKRPLNPILYGYMEMMLHYPGGHEDRCKRGAYPLDWNEVDFVAMHRRKIDLLRNHPDSAGICRKAEEFVAAYEEASGVLRALAEAATVRRKEAALLSLFADMKLLRARVLMHQLTGAGDARALRDALDAEKPLLEERLSPFLEPASVARMCRIWWEPAYITLADG